MSEIQIQQDEETSFAKPFKRSIFRDARLSFGARGLFAMMWDFPANWRFVKSHIVKLSPCGRVQLQGYINELKQVGALEIIPNIMPTIHDHNERLAQSKLNGWIWKLNHPDKWAIEAPLANTEKNHASDKNKKSLNDRFSAAQETRDSQNQSFSKPAAKGLKLQGSTIKEPLPQQTEQQAINSQNASKNLNVSSGSGDFELYFPRQLTPKECEFAKSQLASTELGIAQEILDELASRLNTNSVKSSPLAYLRSLITRSQAGQFTPEAGIRIALAREQAKLEQIKKSAEVIKLSNPNEIPKHLAAMHQVLGRKSTSNLNQED